MAGPSDKIEISHEQLSAGSFIKSGDDLTISTTDLWGDTETILLKDYFLTSPDLVTSKGSTLKGNIVNLLAVDSQPLDQEYVAFEDPDAIGKITIADAPVVVQRLDNFLELQQGDLIYLNDVVEAKAGAVGITFADKSNISIDPGAVMVIDDFVYDVENPTTGSMNANIITGNFSFVSGDIAKTGNDAMKVTTPVLTIGVRGTQVAGKANQDGEENEIVLLPNEDGSVGQVMITNASGSVLLTEAYQATTIATALQPPTVPVILPKEIVLKKFAKTIATTRKTEKKAKVEEETEEAAKEKAVAEEEKEELEEEKEQLEEEAEDLEEEKEELEEEAEKLEEEKEELEEQKEELEEVKEELEEKVEELEEEKQQIEEKEEELQDEIQELEEKLEEVQDEKEIEKLEKKLEKIEKEIIEVEEEKLEIEEQFEEVIEEVEEVEQQVEEVVKEVEQVIEQEQFIEEQVEQVIKQEQVIEQKVEDVVQQVEFVEEKIEIVDQKFDAIVEDFEQFQEEFVQEFKDFIPEEEIQQFIEEAPIEFIEEFKENVIEEYKEERQEVVNEEPIEEVQDEIPEEEIEDIFADEAVEEKLQEIDEKQQELEQKAEELIEKDQQLQEEAIELEEKARELEDKARELEEKIEEAEALGDRDAIEEIEEQFQQLDEEFQEVDQGFQNIQEEYQEIDQGFEELNDEFIDIGNELMEVLEDGPGALIMLPPEALDDRPLMVDENGMIQEDIFVEMDDLPPLEEDIFVQGDQFEDQQQDDIFADDQDQMFMDEDPVFDNQPVFNDEYMPDDNLLAFEQPPQDFYVEEEIYEEPEIDYNIPVVEDYDYLQDLIDNTPVWTNTAPTISAISDMSRSESTDVGSIIAITTAHDVDNDALSFSLVSDESGKLAINDFLGAITLNSAFDAVNTDTSYNVQVAVTDGLATTTEDFVLTVTDDGFITYTYKKNIGVHFTDDGTNQAGGEQVAPVMASFVENLGHTATQMNSFTYNGTNGTLDGIDLLWVTESWGANNNDIFRQAVNSSDSSIIEWIEDGGVAIMHDRHYSYSNLVKQTTTTDPTRSGTQDSDDVTFASLTNLITDGPAGKMYNTVADAMSNSGYTLDGGSSSTHGRTLITSLPTNSNVTVYDDDQNTNYATDFWYGYGSGYVYYSHVPLDCYIGGNCDTDNSNDNRSAQGFRGIWDMGSDVYGENLLHYMVNETIFTSNIQHKYQGTAQADVIAGSHASDILFGKDGADTLWGGDGADDFLYTQTWQTDPGSHDTIEDFDSSEDRIDISAIANGATVGRLLSGTRFKLDPDNDGTYEMEFELTGYTGTADDVTVVV